MTGQKRCGAGGLSRLCAAWCILLLWCIVWHPAKAAGIWAAEERVIDRAGLFSADECGRLEQRADQYGKEIGADLVIVTVDEDTGQTGREYARSYLLDNGYGCGDGREGILFLIDMYQREYTVYEYNTDASGYLLTDYEGDRILDALEDDMRGGRYYEAAAEFLDSCVYYAGVELGENYESDSDLHAEPKGINWLVCLAVGLAGGAVITGVLVLTRNHDEKPSSHTYMKEKKIHVRNGQDLFLNTTVTKRKIETESNNSSGGGGFSGGNSGGGHGGSRSF